VYFYQIITKHYRPALDYKFMTVKGGKKE